VGYSTKFDRLSKSKTVEELYPLIPSDQLNTLINFLLEKLLDPRDSERKWFADQLVILLRHHLGVLQQQKAMVERCLQFFCQYGFFANQSLKKPDQSLLREKLFAILSLMVSDSTEVWASYAVLQVERLEDDHKKVIKLDSEIKKIRKSGIKRMKKLRSMVCHH
jgi:DNA polymerase phi